MRTAFLFVATGAAAISNLLAAVSKNSKIAAKG